MKTLKYVDLVEISAIVFELYEIGYLTGRVNNTLVCLHVFLVSWPLTRDHVS